MRDENRSATILMVSDALTMLNRKHVTTPLSAMKPSGSKGLKRSARSPQSNARSASPAQPDNALPKM